jgi:hypothetical protein
VHPGSQTRHTARNWYGVLIVLAVLRGIAWKAGILQLHTA